MQSNKLHKIIQQVNIKLLINNNLNYRNLDFKVKTDKRKE